MYLQLYTGSWLLVIVMTAGVCNAAVVLPSNVVVPKQSVEMDPGASLFLPLEGGDPIDFEHWAIIAFDTVDQAIKVLETSNSALESTPIRNPRKRPSLYASLTDIDAEEKLPDDWRDMLNGKRQLLSTVARSVGRIEVRNLGDRSNLGRVIGTAFVVAPQILMTNQHVAREFYDFDKKKFRSNPQSRLTAEVSINFAAVRNKPSVVKNFPIVEVIYPFSSVDVDVALLRFDASAGDAPPALPMQETPPTKQSHRPIIVCGYPVDDYSYFMIPAVKRISPGEITSIAPILLDGVKRDLLFHDASTSKGASGSPVVDLDSGNVFGVHYNGENTSNQAEPVWYVLSIPDVRSALGLDKKVVVSSPPQAPVIKIPRPSILLDRENEADSVLSTSLSNLLRRSPGQALEELSISARSVSAVRSHLNRESYVGTGIRIGSKFIIAPAFSGEQEEQLEVSFDKTFDVSNPNYRSARVVERSVSLPEALGATFVLLEVNIEDQVPPLTIDTEAVKVGRVIQVVGYPALGNGDVFQGPLGMKRVSPGKIIAQPGNHADALFHDASTAPGSMGSPVLDASSGHLLGIHVGGSGAGNFAIPSANLAKLFPNHAAQIFQTTIPGRMDSE